jgi:hypothetical protein
MLLAEQRNMKVTIGPLKWMGVRSGDGKHPGLWRGTEEGERSIVSVG